MPRTEIREGKDEARSRPGSRNGGTMKTFAWCNKKFLSQDNQFSISRPSECEAKALSTELRTGATCDIKIFPQPVLFNRSYLPPSVPSIFVW